MPSPGSPSVAIESRKHAARRPRPPLPRDGSGSISSISDIFLPWRLSASATWSYMPRLIRLFERSFPIRNSAEI